MSSVVFLACSCFAAALMVVWAEFRRSQPIRAVFKLIASTTFVAIAWQLDAAGSGYGRCILLALVLSWTGDALLLSERSRVFLSGIFAFLLAHVAFAVAFLRLPIDRTVLWSALVVMGCIGAQMLRWLWPHLKTFYKPAVTAYVLALVAMTSPAIAASAASGRWPYAVGALAFAVSDIAVARNRFIVPGPMNKAWGLPLYYAAQVLLAMSVG